MDRAQQTGTGIQLEAPTRRRSPGAQEAATVGPDLRPPIAAGAFYPADPRTLRALMDNLLEVAPACPAPPPRGLIVPHAAYIQSAAVVARAYARAASTLVPRDDHHARVVLVGASHFAPLRGLAVPSVDAWLTPLGEARIDGRLRAIALDAGAVVADAPHEGEHSVEVQLPFLQVLGGPQLRILPVAVGESDPRATAALLGRLAAVADLVVVSTNLSHGHRAPTTERLDARTIRSVVALDAEAIREWDACAVFALRGAVEWARRSGLRIQLLEHVCAPELGTGRDRSVGYATLSIG